MDNGVQTSDGVCRSNKAPGGQNDNRLRQLRLTAWTDRFPRDSIGERHSSIAGSLFWSDERRLMKYYKHMEERGALMV